MTAIIMVRWAFCKMMRSAAQYARRLISRLEVLSAAFAAASKPRSSAFQRPLVRCCLLFLLFACTSRYFREPQRASKLAFYQLLSRRRPAAGVILLQQEAVITRAPLQSFLMPRSFSQGFSPPRNAAQLYLLAQCR